MEIDGTSARTGSMPSLGATALALAAKGIPVFPLKPGGKLPVIPKSEGGSGFYDATTDAATIRQWWKRWPRANIGMPTGILSGMIVVEIDPRHGGTLDGLTELGGSMPDTLLAQSGGGGWHFFLKHPGGIVKGRKLFKSIEDADAYELKSDGGYVVLAPSIHPNGNRYAWQNYIEAAEMPGWLSRLIAQSDIDEETPRERVSGPVSAHADDAAHWLEWAMRQRETVGDDKAGMLLAVQLLVNDVLDAESVLLDYAERAARNPAWPFTGKDVQRWLTSAAGSRIVQGGKKARGRTPKPSRPRPIRPNVTAEPANEPENMPQDMPPEPEQPPEAPDDYTRPLIIAKDRQLRDMTDEAITALEDANVPPVIFRRNKTLARVRPDENGRPGIEEIDEKVLRSRLTDIADFGRWVKNPEPTSDDDKFIVRPMTPPDDLVRNILAQPDWSLPPLVGIAEAPVLRPDGSILTTPGYDATTRLVYAPSADLHLAHIPAHPTKQDARRALSYLDEVLGDFPYDGAASKAHALALLLTAVARPAIQGKTPLALVTAPAAGTGKGLLAGLVPAIVTGREPSVLTAPATEEEWGKLITSTLMVGPAFILLDDIRGALSSAKLQAALTTTVWEDRALGSNKMVSLPQRAVWMATGNNLQLGGDMPRRCYRIRLDAQMARPERRQGFKHANVTKWARAHRGELLAALLTIARAWYADGSPTYEVTPMGSYEEWAHIIGCILAHAGASGFLANLDEMYAEADSERSQWGAFFLAWHSVYGSHPVTASKVAQDATDTSHPIHGALPDDLAPAITNAGALTKKLGNHLRHQVDLRYEADDGQEVYLTRGGEDRKKTMLWCVKATQQTT